MIDRSAFVRDLQKQLAKIERDLLERSDSAEIPEVARALRAEHARARQAERTASSYEEWRGSYATLISAAWVLSCVFVRFLEDNQLIDPPRISGPGDRLNRARDEHELYFRSHPTHTDRDYLLAVFDDLARLPGGREIFGPHNSVRELPNWLSGDAGAELLGFFRKIDPNVGHLFHDFTDLEWDTHFLGDLYQDLSQVARKRYALLQTPEFVADFILDRTLDPALDDFGLNAEPVKDSSGQPITGPGFRMIDPACGSGHFLLGSFRRILDRWQHAEPGTPTRELVQRTLNSVHGVDVNPYAVAIARFRLLLASMKACGISRLPDAPAFQINVACGDALLHGSGEQISFGWRELDHVYAVEDQQELRRILRTGTFHAIVANPPYITPKDRALNQAYRDRYSTCHRKYTLAVPFMERIFQLAVDDGFAGQITAKSFMTREFGKRVIEEFLPTMDLTHIIDTSSAHIPGHGIPTAILFGRNRRPRATSIRTVMGIRGEPSTPEHAALGHVWTAILEQVDRPGTHSDFVSVADLPLTQFQKHPWSIGGGGAAELKQRLDEDYDNNLSNHIRSIGFASFPGLDDAFIMNEAALRRRAVPTNYLRRFVTGESVRDYQVNPDSSALVPYDSDLEIIQYTPAATWGRHLWLYRTPLANIVSFAGQTRSMLGDKWWAWYRWVPEKYRTALSIVFAFVATHNHFVVDRGGKVFKQSAPVIKLPSTASEDDHIALLGLLNSSTACFWMQQVFHNKGGPGGGSSKDEKWHDFYEFAGTQLEDFPIPAELPLQSAKRLDELAQACSSVLPENLNIHDRGNRSLREFQKIQLAEWNRLRGRMIALQEELDWECYRCYGLITEDLTFSQEPPILQIGTRAFEILMARDLATGRISTKWFERLGAIPLTLLPEQWSEDYRNLVQRRIEVLSTNRDIGLIEQPSYKRRWEVEPWESQLIQALIHNLLERLEAHFDFDGRMKTEGQCPPTLRVSLISTSQLAHFARQDPEFMEVAEVYRDDPAFDVQQLVTELVDSESVPLLPVLRYKPSGLRKRAAWEETWELQREEDAIDARTKLPKTDPQFLTEEQAQELKRTQVGEIPVPPKYTSADFLKSDYWRLRGKLDVPKERWVCFPYCDGADGTMVIAWAGYDHLQLARAISAYYVEILERLGGRDDPRLEPLLACLIELLPWLKQWHNDVDPEFGVPMGDYFEGFIAEEARQMGKTPAQIKAWQPPQRASSRTRRRRVVSETS